MQQEHTQQSPNAFEQLVEDKDIQISRLRAQLANIETSVREYRENQLAQSMISVYEVLMEDMISEVAFEVHKSLTVRNRQLERCQQEQKLLTTIDFSQQQQAEKTPNSTTTTAAASTSTSATTFCECGNCKRQIACSRFTQHLDKCLNRAPRRLASANQKKHHYSTSASWRSSSATVTIAPTSNSRMATPEGSSSDEEEDEQIYRTNTNTSYNTGATSAPPTGVTRGRPKGSGRVNGNGRGRNSRNSRQLSSVTTIAPPPPITITQ